MALIFAVFLLHMCGTQGISAVTPVFVQTGEDLFLDVKEPVELKEDSNFIWQYRGSDNIVKYNGLDEHTIHKSYKNRAEFSVQNYSLLLKNVQKKDIGRYRGYVSADKDHTVAEYTVTVQDRVSAVEMTASRVSGSSDSCTLSVTCSTQDSHINSTVRCSNLTCSQEAGEPSEVTASGASLRVSLVNESIICNHSNQVSWTKDIIVAEQLCIQHATDPSEANNNVLVIFIIIPIIIIIIISVVCFQRRQRLQKYSPASGAESNR